MLPGALVIVVFFTVLLVVAVFLAVRFAVVLLRLLSDGLRSLPSGGAPLEGRRERNSQSVSGMGRETSIEGWKVSIR
jgi:hypothetical protein